MTASQMVAKARHLPPVSQAALRLVNLLGKAEVANEQVVQVLKCDNVLTAKLLRACNSPALGLSEPIASLDQAVLLLGHSQILHMVLNLTFSSTMAVALPGYAVQANELWNHSLITATAAELVAKQMPRWEADGSVAFTVGLLHDIGKLVMNESLTPDNQNKIRQLVSDCSRSRVEAEREVTGTDHAEVGACLLYVWRLPDLITEAVGNHHQPAVHPELRLSSLVHLANFLAHLAGSAPGWEAYAIRTDNRVVQALNLTETMVEVLVMSVRQRFDEMSQAAQAA